MTLKLCFAMHMLLYYCNMTLYYNEKIVTHKTQHMKHVSPTQQNLSSDSAVTQQWLSTSQHQKIFTTINPITFIMQYIG